MVNECHDASICWLVYDHFFCRLSLRRFDCGTRPNSLGLSDLMEARSESDLNWRNREKKGEDLEGGSWTCSDKPNFLEVGKERLKYCPGAKCRLWLPLHRFATNCNMADGFDIYCVECNLRKRKDRRDRQQRTSLSLPFQDEYELFLKERQRKEYESQQSWRLGAPPEHRSMGHWEARAHTLRYLKHAITEAKLKHKLSIPLDENTVFSKLFVGRRLICTQTGETITPACFLDHHAIKLEVDSETNRLHVKCNKCRVP